MSAAVFAESALFPQDRAQLTGAVDYSGAQNLTQVWMQAAKQFGNLSALRDRHATPPLELTFGELADYLQTFAAGLQTLLDPIDPSATEEYGVRVPPRVALFADNSARWFVADQGTMAAGLANAVRSSAAETEELLYILGDSGAKVLIIENQKTLKRLADRLGEFPLGAIVLLSDEEPQRGPIAESVMLLNFWQLLEQGRDRLKTQPWQAPDSDHQTLATLIYTSGTTGKPKGVMLSHGNYIYQLSAFRTVVAPKPGDRTLTLLPTWHSFGRIGDYYLLCQGSVLVYTNLRSLKADLKAHRPNYMMAVPRLWESIYEGVQKQFQSQPASKQKIARTFLGLSERYVRAKRCWQGLELRSTPAAGLEKLTAGGKALLYWPLHRLGDRLVYGKIREATGGDLRYAISGGGSLAAHLELFFEIVGVNVLVGYGLTETSPVLTVRRNWRNLRGTSGLPLPATELRSVDLETRRSLPTGQKGLILARGPQIMAGYFGKPDATAKAIDPEGWFDTGDLGWLSPLSDITITGRAKDTIVLTNGENIEPQPIEDACIRSPYISQIVLVGQDQKTLGALIVPDRDAIAILATEQGWWEETLDWQGDRVKALIRDELAREVKNRPGYKAEERIATFCFLEEPLSIDNGLLTQTMKVRRNVVADRYATEIARLFQ
ncbi:MAG: long-chain fatty acid--CoA ligase [Oscillatoriales cyanobacterium]|nr:MAG: long-chain fatty acid--CoA ligase [Oscillatoriales cyanobacterium]